MDIYKITNQINGKIYVGLTTRSAMSRFKEHIKLSETSNYAIHRAIKKYGAKNFTVVVLESSPNIEILIKRESYWIKTFDSMNPYIGYNMINQEDFKKIFSSEVRDKISKSQIERFNTMSNEEKLILYRNTSKARQGIKKNINTRYVGVTKAKFGRFACDTSYLGKRYRKLFLSEIDAAMAYDRIVLYIYGEDAKLNFPNKKNNYLEEDLILFMEWFLNDKSTQGRPAKLFYIYNDLIAEAKINAKKEIISQNIKSYDVVDLTFMYNGKINPDFLLKYAE